MSSRLDPGRPVRIGRDSDNEIVLRDPRVSRHHARIVFEKGFYVIYDLASANGTVVNGKRVSIAPLVDGAVIRIGSCTGRFSDPTVERPPGDPADPGMPAASAAVPEVLAAPEPLADEGPASTNPYPLAGPENDTEPRSIADVPGEEFRIELAAHGPQTVKNGSDDPILYFDLPPRLVGWVGRLVAWMVGVSGITAAVILATQGHVVPLAAALLLTAIFVALILFLIPPNEIYLCRDPAMLQVDLVVRQRRVPITTNVYETADRSGAPLACFRKNRWSSLGRRRWWIVTPSSMIIGWAEEDSLPRALARKVAGHAVRALRSNYRFVFEGEFVGRLERRDQENVVDLAPDTERRFDRRIALPLSVLIVAVEGK